MDSCDDFHSETMQKIRAFDLSVFGADRSRLLDELIADSDSTPQVIVAASGELQGYALSRQGLAASYIGPIVALDGFVALDLLDRTLGQLGKQNFYLDFHPDCGVDRTELVKRGFIEQRQLRRMHYGTGRINLTSRLVFAIAGPEMG
jgi:hypothetical protein